MADPDHKAEVQAFFGVHARAYTSSPVHARGASLTRLVALTDPTLDHVALDVATGTGHTALAFAPRVRSVVGTDLTRQMLVEASRLARQGGIRNVCFCQGDAERLPFASGSFTIVTCRIAPHHFADAAGALREMARVCQAGGWVAIADNITPADPATAAYINAFETLRDPSHHWAYSLTQWHTLFAQAGLKLEAEETLTKTMNFSAWTTRMGVDDDTVEELRQYLFNAPTSSHAYLRPRVENQETFFDLTEGLFVGRKAR